jgi:hypothetical protein
MIYEVEGGTKAQRKIVDEAMSYVIHLLDIPNNVKVWFTLGKFVSHGVVQLSKTKYDIEIVKTVSVMEIAYTVFHEMKHVEQLANKRLVHTCGATLWEGEDHSNVEYFDRPWEKEAYKFEKSADMMLTSLAA